MSGAWRGLRTARGQRFRIQDVGVRHRRRDIRVTQKLLYRADVVVVLEEVCRDGAHGRERHANLDLGPSARPDRELPLVQSVPDAHVDSRSMAQYVRDRQRPGIAGELAAAPLREPCFREFAGAFDELSPCALPVDLLDRVGIGISSTDPACQAR
jgi:hypothetical protein